MPARCLNKALLIGNLTRDPELRYTPSGSAVCSFGVATNRYWATDTGERKEDTQFHRIVAWNKLAEICSQLLGKGDKVYIEGRLQTRQWTGADGASRTTTEVVASDMILLRSQRAREGAEEPVVEEPAEIGETATEGALEAQAPVAEGTGEGGAAPAPKQDDTKAKTGPRRKKKEKTEEEKEEKETKEEEQETVEEEIKIPGETEETEKRPF